MARRRKIVGRALLVASAGVVMACDETADLDSGATSNPVAPPRYELCVTVEPTTAAVQIDAADLEPDGCNSVYHGSNTVNATAEGFVDYTADVEVGEDTTHAIVLEPATE